jgi:hypothetical protein
MRQAEEASIWSTLTKRFSSLSPEVVKAEGIDFDVSRPCTVVGGRNGTGKSRVLHSLKAELGERAILIDLHAICEQALNVLRTQSDLEDLKEEAGPMQLPPMRIDDVERIVGRKYERIEWYGLDVVPGDADVAARFKWGTDQTVIPYFEATYRDVDYDSLNMGLGELSTHLLFWILQQYEQTSELIILMDEPDAYLPPVAASALVSRLLNLCKDRSRGWRIVLTTHSADLIADALEHDAFVLLERDAHGATIATQSADDPTIANVLLARPPVRSILFVEDESAFHLTRALVDGLGPKDAGGLSIVWGRGYGYMLELRKHLPKSRSPIAYALVFDGDQRSNDSIPVPLDGHWPAIFLPSGSDPDSLFITSHDPAVLAKRLGKTTEEVARVIETFEARDAHDWVNGLADAFDRGVVLSTLASLWVEANAQLAGNFQSELRSALP